jgi:seryl-tRNA synthetase
MLAKKYSDSGGLLSEEDSQKLVRSYSELAEIQTNLSKLMSKKSKSKEDQDAVASLTEEFSAVRRSIVDLETTYQAVFNHTADTKAQNKTILWYLVNLAFSKGPDGVDRPLFQGEDYDDKLDSYYEKDENGDAIYNLAKEKLMAFVSFWYFSQNTTEEDFKKLEKDMDDGAV